MPLRPDDEVKTLKWCNEIRRSRDLPPLEEMPENYRATGHEFRSLSCPVARAIGAQVTYTTYGNEQGEWTLPDYVRRTIYAYDDQFRR